MFLYLRWHRWDTQLPLLCRLQLVVKTLRRTNQNSIQSPKLLSQLTRNYYYKTFGDQCNKHPKIDGWNLWDKIKIFREKKIATTLGTWEGWNPTPHGKFSACCGYRYPFTPRKSCYIISYEKNVILRKQSWKTGFFWWIFFDEMTGQSIFRPFFAVFPPPRPNGLR